MVERLGNLSLLQRIELTETFNLAVAGNVFRVKLFLFVEHYKENSLEQFTNIKKIFKACRLIGNS